MGTPLIAAAAAGHANVVELLVSATADLHLIPFGIQADPRAPVPLPARVSCRAVPSARLLHCAPVLGWCMSVGLVHVCWFSAHCVGCAVSLWRGTRLVFHGLALAVSGVASMSQLVSSGTVVRLVARGSGDY
jgi:hypothetical protein